jgi:hypothetical protein
MPRMQGWPFISVIATAGEFLVDLLFQIRWQRDVHGGRRLQTGVCPGVCPAINADYTNP